MRDGALVERVDPKGPAKKAGIEKGDIITYFNGRKIFTASDLDQVLAKLKPGQKVFLTFSQNGLEKDSELTLGREKPLPKPAAKTDSAAQAEGGYLGISMTNAPGDRDGALVQEVYQQSPAQKAGIRPGDIIAFINGRKVFEGWDIVEETSSHGPGARMEVSVLRDGKEFDLEVVLGRIPRAKSARRQQAPPPQPRPQAADNTGDVRQGWLGVHLFNTTQQQGGATVAKVMPNGPAHMAGIKEGDIITMVNGRKVSATPDLVMAIRSLPAGSRVKIGLLRNGRGMVLNPILAQRPPEP
jgi:S1-C subfamily serine protease